MDLSNQEIIDMVVQDREDGLTYAALVEKYKEYGATTKRIRNITKGVEKSKPKPIQPVKKAPKPADAVNAILPLAMRKQGVKPSEYFHIFHDVYGTVIENHKVKLDMTARQRSYVFQRVKAKAIEAGGRALFVPEWMDADTPDECNKLILTLAQNLYESIEDNITTFLEQYPALDEVRGGGWSIRNELMALVVQGYTPEGVENRCQRNKEVVDELIASRGMR